MFPRASLKSLCLTKGVTMIRICALVEGEAHSNCTYYFSSDLNRSILENIDLSTCGGNSGSFVNRFDSCNQLVGHMCFIRMSYLRFWSNVQMMRQVIGHFCKWSLGCHLIGCCE